MKVGVTLIKICIICGKEFTTKPKAGNRKYCSVACSKAANSYKKRSYTKVCPVCHKTFRAYKKTSICCSYSCANVLWRGEVKKHLDHFCHICGKAFVPAYRGQKYCSDVCRSDPKAQMMRIFFSKLVNKEISF